MNLPMMSEDLTLRPSSTLGNKFQLIQSRLNAEEKYYEKEMIFKKRRVFMDTIIAFYNNCSVFSLVF